MCAIPDTLFDSVIGGHVAGAFTGAEDDMDGLMAEADGGTVFLDEISSLAVASQAKLLRVLESRRVRPVGSKSERPIDCRIVAATNGELGALVGTRQLRADLLYRLRGAAIAMPPLRDRREDIPLLARRFLASVQSGSNGAQRMGITQRAIRLLDEQQWPGNVRELRRAVEFAAVIADDEGLIDEQHVATALETASPAPVSGRIHMAHMPADGQHELLALLERHRGDTLAVSEELGVTRKTVYQRLQRNGLSIRDIRRRYCTLDNEGLSAGERGEIHPDSR